MLRPNKELQGSSASNESCRTWREGPNTENRFKPPYHVRLWLITSCDVWPSGGCHQQSKTSSHSQADVQLPTLCTTGILNYATRATWHWMFSTYKHTLSVRISRVLHCRSNTRCSRVCVPANSAHDWNIGSFLILRLSGIAFRTTNLNLLNHPLCYTTEGVTRVPRSAAD